MSADQSNSQSSELKRVRLILLRIAAITSSFMALLVAGVLGWLFLYTADLPDVRTFAAFTPETPTAIADVTICGDKTRVIALPAADLATLRNVLIAAEGPVDPRNMLRRLYDDRAVRRQYGKYSFHLARQLLCNQHRRSFEHALAEARTAIQLERRFAADQLLDMYLNTAYFDDDIYSVENGAQHYFGKHAVQLSSSEAALLIGIIRGPGFYSPLRHPDRALTRRNEVIDAMADQHLISHEVATAAKSTSLSIKIE